jgi:hypothetical protein
VNAAAYCRHTDYRDLWLGVWACVGGDERRGIRAAESMVAAAVARGCARRERGGAVETEHRGDPFLAEAAR